MLLRNLIAELGDDDGNGGGPDAESASACIGLQTSTLVVCRWRSKLADKLERASLLVVDTPFDPFLLPTFWIVSGLPMSLHELEFPITARAMLLPGAINGPYASGRCMKICLYEFVALLDCVWW